MAKRSAGILVYRRGNPGVEVLLVHPGGPFFAKKDAGVWSIPKGEYDDPEDPLTCARREFAEELGSLSDRSATEANQSLAVLPAKLDFSHWEDTLRTA